MRVIDGAEIGGNLSVNRTIPRKTNMLAILNVFSAFCPLQHFIANTLRCFHAAFLSKHENVFAVPDCPQFRHTIKATLAGCAGKLHFGQRKACAMPMSD